MIYCAIYLIGFFLTCVMHYVLNELDVAYFDTTEDMFVLKFLGVFVWPLQVTLWLGWGFGATIVWVVKKIRNLKW